MAKKYRGKWIALKADRKTVVSSGTTVQQALDGAQKKGVKKPILTRMPKEPRSFVGTNSRA